MKKIISILCCICLLVSYLPMSVYAADETIIVSSDAIVTHEGTWSSTSNANAQDPNGGSTYYTETVGGSATYDLSSFSGTYDLYIYGRTFNATTTIATVQVNGNEVGTFDSTTVQDGAWLAIGTYELAEGSTLKIVNTSGGVMRDAAIKVTSNTTGVALQSGLKQAGDTSEIVISCNDGKTVYGGTWAISTSNKVIGPTGGSSKYATVTGASVSYDLSCVDAGRYDLYVYNLYFSHKSTDVLVEIASEDGNLSGHYDAAAVAANSRNAWIPLGTYTFGETGNSVTFTNQVDLSLRDAGIKLVRNAEGDAIEADMTDIQTETEKEIEGRTIEPDSYIILGSDADGFMMSGDWKVSSVQYPRGTGYYSSVVGAWAQWNPNLTAAEDITLWYLVPSVTSTEDPALKVEVYAEGQLTTIEIDFTTGDPRWVELGTFDFDGSYEEYVKIIKQEKTEGTASRITNLRLGYASAVADENVEEETLYSVYTGTEKEILQRIGILTGTEDGITEAYIQTIPTQQDLDIIALKLDGNQAGADAYNGTDNSEIDATEYAQMLLEKMGYGTEAEAADDLLAYFNQLTGTNVSESKQFTIDVLAEMTVAALSTNMNSEVRSFLGAVMNNMEPISESVYTDPSVFTAEMKTARENAKKRERSLIYNNDGNDAYVAYDYYPAPFDLTNVTEEISVENFLSKRTTGLEDSQVDSVFYCTGVYNSYHHVSEIADMRQRDWAPLLISELNTDSMSIILDWCKENDREFMWSMRMNDVHDRQYEEQYLDSFKRENPDYLVSSRDTAVFDLKLAPGYWSALDYGELGVRQRTYDLLREVLLNYDVDGIELDFSRWSVYFEQVVTEGEDADPENLERMNNLMRSLRTLTEQVSAEKGTPILLAIHVSDSMAFNKAIGLDVEQWMDEGLVDIVSLRSWGAWQTMEDGLAEYESYDVPVYLVMDDILKTNDYDWNKEAGLAYEVGYTGVQLYNVFDPNSNLFNTLGSAETAVYDPDYSEKTRAETDGDKAVDAKARFLTYTKEAQNIFFSQAEVAKTVDSQPFALTVNGMAEGSTITYSSNNAAVATVDETTGEVTVRGVGVAEITANAAATSTHKAASAKYTLTVVEKTEGYTVALSGTTSKVVDETVPITITIDNSDLDTYNAVDIILSYDAQKLSAPAQMDGYTIENSDGRLRIFGYGADKETGSSITVNFVAKAEGEAVVTLTSAKVDISANAVADDAPDAEITSSTVTVAVGGYSVNLPDDFVGDEVVSTGEDYTFAAKNPYYDYVLAVTMGGEAVEVSLDENGNYVIENVTGDLVITVVEKTPKSFNVTINGDATGEETATYLTDYSFTLNRTSGYSYEVAVRIGGTDFTNMTVEGDTYKIPGASVTGEIVITVTATPLPVTTCNITFAGNGAEDATGDTVTNLNEDYSFTVNKIAGYTYSITAKRGDDFITVKENADGSYTIAAADVTGDIVITIEKVVTVLVNEAVKLDDSKSVFLIRVSAELTDGKVYAFDGDVMYWSDIHGWCYMVISEGVVADVAEGLSEKISVIDGEKTNVSHGGDVNGTGLVDINDAQLVYDIYNAKYDDFTVVSMIKYLRSDVNGDGKIDVTDAAAVISKIN